MPKRMRKASNKPCQEDRVDSNIRRDYRCTIVLPTGNSVRRIDCSSHTAVQTGSFPMYKHPCHTFAVEHGA